MHVCCYMSGRNHSGLWHVGYTSKTGSQQMNVLQASKAALCALCEPATDQLSLGHSPVLCHQPDACNLILPDTSLHLLWLMLHHHSAFCTSLNALCAHLCVQGLRRVHFMLKGINLRQLPSGKSQADPLLGGKLTAEFICPRLHFALPQGH